MLQIFLNKSTDIINNSISGRTIVGSYIYLYDIDEWKLVGEDLTLSDTTNPIEDPTPEQPAGTEVSIVNALPSGNNTIGKVNILGAIPHGTNTIGNVNISDNNGSITVDQNNHDNFNVNANIQVNNSDVSNANPVFAQLVSGNNIIGTVKIMNSLGNATIDPLSESTFNAILGEVQSNPTINTILGRLKDLLTGIILSTGDNIIGKVSIDQTSNGTTNKVVPVQSTHDNLNCNSNLQVNNTDVSDVNPIPIIGEVETNITPDLADTARSISTKVIPIQIIDSSGKVSPAGDTYDNGIFTNNRLVDENGIPYGIPSVEGKPRVSSTPYLYDISEGHISGHERWERIGYSTVVGTATKDIWSYSDNIINVPTTSTAMEVYTNNAQDLGTIIRGPLTSDPGGDSTTLVDISENFTAATAVSIGDLIILDKSGASPEYGFITGVSATSLTIGNGFSRKGSGANRNYYIIRNASTTGAHAVLIKYLTTSFAEKCEIVILGGNATGVDLINTDVYRINSFTVISTGSNGSPLGAIQIQNANGTPPIYNYISAGYTVARNSMFTVPLNKLLYIVQFTAGYATTANQVQNSRIILRATQDNLFKTNTFQPLAELLCVNDTIPIEMIIPIKITSGVDIKCTAVPTANGQITTILRGWIEFE